MWVARNKDGRLGLFTDRPFRGENNNWCSRTGWYMEISSYFDFNNTWKDEPFEVTIVPTSFIKEVSNLTDAICGSELGRPENKEKGDVLVSMKKVSEQINNIRWKRK